MSKQYTLEDLRKHIDQVDDQLIHLLDQRMKFVNEVGHLKRGSNAAIYRPDREKAIIDRMVER
ncbi:MAG: chorismate mutase/prephenate dehydratase, partial [Cyclobacteriaceae bacterium]